MLDYLLEPDIERPICHCEKCKEPLYNGDTAYDTEDGILCESCMDDLLDQWKEDMQFEVDKECEF